jgi:hypothetical protein
VAAVAWYVAVLAPVTGLVLWASRWWVVRGYRTDAFTVSSSPNAATFVHMTQVFGFGHGVAEQTVFLGLNDTLVHGDVTGWGYAAAALIVAPAAVAALLRRAPGD